MNLSNTSNAAGRTVTTHTNPINTPFAITRPMSFPMVSCIVHNAKKPAIVVSELPTTDDNVLLIAFDIASYILFDFFFSD